MPKPNHSGLPAVFMDRDGTLIEYVPYLHDPEQVALLPGVAPSLRRLSLVGWRLVVVTNQSGIGRKSYPSEAAVSVNERLSALLRSDGVELDLVLFCPHSPDKGCACRKPRPGLAFEASRKLGLDLEASFVIGDNISDMEFGRAIGATTILVETGLGSEHKTRCTGNCDHVVPAFADAATVILAKRA